MLQASRNAPAGPSHPLPLIGCVIYNEMRATMIPRKDDLQSNAPVSGGANLRNSAMPNIHFSLQSSFCRETLDLPNYCGGGITQTIP